VANGLTYRKLLQRDGQRESTVLTGAIYLPAQQLGTTKSSILDPRTIFIALSYSTSVSCPQFSVNSTTYPASYKHSKSSKHQTPLLRTTWLHKEHTILYEAAFQSQHPLPVQKERAWITISVGSTPGHHRSATGIVWPPAKNLTFWALSVSAWSSALLLHLRSHPPAFLRSLQTSWHLIIIKSRFTGSWKRMSKPNIRMRISARYIVSTFMNGIKMTSIESHQMI